jgi:putative membrane protein
MFTMKKYYIFLFLFALGLLISAIHPRNYYHWAGEVAAPVTGMVILVSTFKRFRYSVITYSAILFSCFLMFVGAHYTFSRVPLFDWLRDFLGQDRNYYDKFGHFFQGIIPVLMVRELFLRRKNVTGYKLISFISFCICMATTAVYELIEYIVCSLAGGNPSTFLGTQGDIWDSQSDMLAAALGGLFILFVLRKVHDRIIEKEFPGTFVPVSETNSITR